MAKGEGVFVVHECESTLGGVSQICWAALEFGRSKCRERVVKIACIRAVFMASIITSSLPLSGCMTTMYVGGATMSLPQATTLQASDPVYLKLKLEVVLNNSAYNIQHIWHCNHERHFSMGDGKWHLSYFPSQVSFVRQLTPEAAVYVGLPACPGGSAGLLPADPKIIAMLVNPSDPEFAIKLSDDVSLSGTGHPMLQHIEYVKVGAEIVETRISPEESKLLERLKAFHYESVYGRLYTREEWVRSPILSATLNGLNSVTVAPPHKLYLGLSEFAGFAEFRSMRPRSQRVSFKFNGDAWEMEQIDLANAVQTYRRASPQSDGWARSRSVVRYKGIQTGKMDRTQQVYDPDSRWLIDVNSLGFSFN